MGVRQSVFEKIGEADLLSAVILEQNADTIQQVQDELITETDIHCKITLERRQIFNLLELINSFDASLENADSTMVSDSSWYLKMPKYKTPFFDNIRNGRFFVNILWHLWMMAQHRHTEIQPRNLKSFSSAHIHISYLP